MIWPAANALIVRDLRLLWRRRGAALQPALFALLVILLFALALCNEPRTLAKFAPGLLCVAVPLSGLLSLDPLLPVYAEVCSLEPSMLAQEPPPLLFLFPTLNP